MPSAIFYTTEILDKYLCISIPTSRPSILKGFRDFYAWKFMVEYLQHGAHGRVIEIWCDRVEGGIPASDVATPA